MTSPGQPLDPLPLKARLRGWLPGVLLSLLISLLIVSPFFWLGNASGHDFQFHAESWLDAASQWKEGIVFPRWAEWANYGLGEPRFIFYPPISWMLGAALVSVLPLNTAPVVFIALIQTLAGCSAFALARRFLPQRAAMFCAACYTANPYALLIVYMRSDFAELLANALFPLLLIAAFEICELLGSRQPLCEEALRRATAGFAVVFALIWLSNAPAGVIASYSIAILFLFAALKRKAWRPLLRGGAGLALGFCLCGFYLLPAAYEQRWVNIGQALSTGLLPSENFLYTVINDPEHTLFNWIASTIAVLMIALTGVAAIAARRPDDAGSSVLQTKLWPALSLLAGLAILLMLRFTSFLWQHLPKLRFVQFPWRWMSLLAVPLAIFLGAAMARKRWGWLWAVLTFALLGTAGVALVHKGWWDTEDIPVLRQAIANGSGFDGTDEYDPAGDDHTNIPTKSPEVMVMDTDTMQGPLTKPRIHMDRWTPEEKEVSFSSREPFFLGIRLLNYPAWRVEVNGTKVTPRGGEDYNQMIVPLPAGESRLRVRFVRTWDRTLGGLLSLAGALVAAWLLLTGFRVQRTRL